MFGFSYGPTTLNNLTNHNKRGASMKKLLLAVVAICVVASSSFAQGKIQFGIGADVALPISSGFSNSQSIGIGGTARVYYPLSDQMITLTGTAGYMTFSGKDQTIAGVNVTGTSWSMIPVLVGGRYYFTPAGGSMRWYGAFEMGLIFSSFSVTVPSVNFQTGQVTSTTATATGSDFSYQPQIGFEAKQWDIGVRYLGVSGAGCVAARIGYIFR